MEIFVEDIPEEGMDVEATEKDVWLGAVLRNSLGETDCRAKLSLHMTRVEGNVGVDGDVELISHPVCDRCLAPFEESESLHIHEVLAPLYESKRQQRLEENLEIELVAEDMEFSFYEGDSIDLGEVVREQITLARPMKHLCKEGCKGLCQRCGKNLNEGPCGCPPQEHKSSFGALKSFQVKGKKAKAKKQASNEKGACRGSSKK